MKTATRQRLTMAQNQLIRAKRKTDSKVLIISINTLLDIVWYVGERLEVW